MSEDGKVTVLPDGSAFTTMSFPLGDDHWLYADHHNVPPMPLRCGTRNLRHEQLCDAVRAAARYAIRGATMNGREKSWDPDALVQNMVVGLLGYHTPDGLSRDAWANPNPLPPALDEPLP